GPYQAKEQHPQNQAGGYTDDDPLAYMQAVARLQQDGFRFAAVHDEFTTHSNKGGRLGLARRTIKERGSRLLPLRRAIPHDRLPCMFIYVNNRECCQKAIISLTQRYLPRTTGVVPNCLAARLNEASPGMAHALA